MAAGLAHAGRPRSLRNSANVALCLALMACSPADNPVTARDPGPSATTLPAQAAGAAPAGKPVVYQLFTRLFGNKVARNKPWGTIEENGVGKFADINEDALRGLRELGVTHVWYTGVPHHAVIRDYSAVGIGDDDPDVVKGRAGSPYAVKDYYNVNPDLAVDPGRRLVEFKALIERTHQHGMRVIIDIVPNHVARAYRSVSRPDGIADFGANDDTAVEWARDNNFYYVSARTSGFPPAYKHLAARRIRSPTDTSTNPRHVGPATARAPRSLMRTTGMRPSRSTTAFGPTAVMPSKGCRQMLPTGRRPNTSVTGRARRCRTAGGNSVTSFSTGPAWASTDFATTWPRWCPSSSGAT